jgi:hypothetical protein
LTGELVSVPNGRESPADRGYLDATVCLGRQESCNDVWSRGEGRDSLSLTPGLKYREIRVVCPPGGSRFLGAGVACRLLELEAKQRRQTAAVGYDKAPRRGVIGGHKRLLVFNYFRVHIKSWVSKKKVYTKKRGVGRVAGNLARQYL